VVDGSRPLGSAESSREPSRPSLLHANEVVSGDRLIDELWGEAAGVRDDPAPAADAAASLREALDLWRGAPPADFAYESFARRRLLASGSSAWQRSSGESMPTSCSADTQS
jgi:hypothetical protein